MKYKSISNIRGFSFVVFCCLAWPGWAETNRYTGEIWALVDSQKVMEAARDIALAKYPDCDDATVERKMVRLYRADGTGESQDETFTKVLTEKGKRNNRTISLSFMLPYSTVEVAKVEVLKPDGKAVAVDVAANSKEQIDDSQMSANISDPNSRVLRVNIPELEIGDMVHSVTRETTTRAIMEGEFADENVFEEGGFLRHTTYEIYAPSDRPLQQIALRDEVPGTVRYSAQPGTNGMTLHHWEIDNVPRMFPEPNMPSGDEVLQRVLASTTRDWQTVSKWYWDLSKPHLAQTTPEMTKMAQDLAASGKTDLEKIKAVFYYVSKNIRYMGVTPEQDRPGFEPHDVKITFDKKYGVCRDKAALLVAMLQAAGFKSYPVLMSVGVKRDPGVPDPFFNHAIVSVELKKGEYVLMDPTDEHTRELLPEPDCNQSFLVCRPEGEDLKISPVPPPTDHLMLIKTTGTLTAAGTLEAKSELDFQGVNDDEYRNAFSHMKPDDMRRFFEGNLKSTMPGARLKSLHLTPSDMMDVSVPLRAELEFTSDGMTVDGNGKSVVTLPWIGKRFGIINFIMGGTGLEKRKYPLETEVTCGLEESLSLKMTGDFSKSVSMPSCAPVDDDCLSYHENCAFANGDLDCTRELALKTVEFSPVQYLKLKQTLKSLEYDQRKVPILATSGKEETAAVDMADKTPVPPTESNAKILESHKELLVQDAHSSVYRIRYSKEILNYAGKIREAEVRWEFNPSCQEAKIVHGDVISKTGERQHISDTEIHVMDAGWDASAKRYTGGKILVANLPGVDVGSTIEVELEVTTKGKPFIAGTESFELPDEMAKKSFLLTAPDGVKLQKMVSGEAGAIKEADSTEAGKAKWEWSTENAKALPTEPALPPVWVYSPCVVYYVGDLAAYLKDVNDTMLDRSHKSTKAAELALQLTKPAKSRLEAIQAIRDFVAKSIRQAGPAFTDLPLTELSAADTTLSDGYGHAADRAILLHAMLTAAGFQPEFVLASVCPPGVTGVSDVVRKFPMPEAYSVPLVRVNLDGKTYYLNDTDQYAKLGATGYDGRLGIVLSSQAPEIIKAAEGCADESDTDFAINVSEDGKTRIGVTHRYYGGSFGGKNHYFSELPPEERRRYFQELVSGMSQGAHAVGDLVTKFDTYPGLEQFTVEIDNYSVVDGNYLYFDLPFAPSLLTAGADHRTLPMLVSGHSHRSVHAEIELPAQFRQVVMAPKSETLSEPDGSGVARIATKQEGNRYSITEDFEISPAIISPKDYPELLKVESTLGRKSSTIFLLEKAAE